MKNKRSARSARTTAKNIHISQGGRDLSAQAGLIPVVKFFHKEGIVSKTEQTVDHQRGATGLYDALDMVILSVVGIVGGARSIGNPQQSGKWQMLTIEMMLLSVVARIS